MADGAPADPPVPSGRPRLNLKKRDEGEAKKLEAKRTTKSNPFGAARPREAVLCVRWRGPGPAAPPGRQGPAPQARA